MKHLQKLDMKHSYHHFCTRLHRSGRRVRMEVGEEPAERFQRIQDCSDNLIINTIYTALFHKESYNSENDENNSDNDRDPCVSLLAVQLAP